MKNKILAFVSIILTKVGIGYNPALILYNPSGEASSYLQIQ